LKPVTVLAHINTLFENGYIDEDLCQNYIKPLKDSFPKEIKEWIENGLKLEGFEKLREFLSLYGTLYTPR
jgi:hypothetical protein